MSYRSADSDATKQPPVRHLARPEGRIAYTVEGRGPLVVAVPGMGDLRSTYRDVAGPIVEAGHRLAIMDLRGHGDSDTTFHRHGDDVTGQDILALIDELGGPAVVLGNSMGGSAGAWAAAERPDAIAGLVLVDPLLRNPPMGRVASAAMRLALGAALRRPWGPAFWGSYYTSINRGHRADWLPDHVAAIRANLREPGRLRSFRHLALTLDHSVVERRLTDVRAPMRVFVGEMDPDYRDPAAEAQWMRELGAQVDLVPDAGHYPHAQQPAAILPGILEFLGQVRPALGSRDA